MSLTLWPWRIIQGHLSFSSISKDIFRAQTSIILYLPGVSDSPFPSPYSPLFPTFIPSNYIPFCCGELSRLLAIRTESRICVSELPKYLKMPKPHCKPVSICPLVPQNDITKPKIQSKKRTSRVRGSSWLSGSFLLHHPISNHTKQRSELIIWKKFIEAINIIASQNSWIFLKEN